MALMYSRAIEKYRKEGKMMKTKGKIRIIALIGIMLLPVLLLPGAAAAMEIFNRLQAEAAADEAAKQAEIEAAMRAANG